MDQERRTELEARLKQALKEHQSEGLHLVGGVEQLIARLVRAVEDWAEDKPQQKRKTA